MDYDPALLAGALYKSLTRTHDDGSTYTVVVPPTVKELKAALPRLKAEFEAARDADRTRYRIAAYVKKPRGLVDLIVLKPNDPVPTEHGPLVFTHNDDLGIPAAIIYTYCLLRARRSQYSASISEGAAPDRECEWVYALRPQIKALTQLITRKVQDGAWCRRRHLLAAFAAAN